MESTYWNHKGKYEAIAAEVQKLIPASGECATPALERCRQAINCYYDLYNNGLCNRAAEFRKVFGFSGVKFAKGFLDAEIEARIESRMSAFIIDAAMEAGLVDFVLKG